MIVHLWENSIVHGKTQKSPSFSLIAVHDLSSNCKKKTLNLFSKRTLTEMSPQETEAETGVATKNDTEQSSKIEMTCPRSSNSSLTFTTLVLSLHYRTSLTADSLSESMKPITIDVKMASIRCVQRRKDNFQNPFLLADHTAILFIAISIPMNREGCFSHRVSMTDTC